MKFETILLQSGTTYSIPITGNYVVITSTEGIKVAELENQISSATSGNYFTTHLSGGNSDPQAITIPWDAKTMYLRQDTGAPALFSYYTY